MTAPESPAGVLRRAAKLMRERAEYCTEGPWGTGSTRQRQATVVGRSDQLAATCKYWPDATHVAAWHPEVAVAVAALLETRADEYDELAGSGYGIAGAWFVAGDGEHADPAIRTARVYLGETEADLARADAAAALDDDLDEEPQS